jgi:predicted nucleotidyltransferase
VSFEADLSASQIADAFFDLKLELEALFNRPVDLITKASLTNPYFRQSVMAGQRALYAA